MKSLSSPWNPRTPSAARRALAAVLAAGLAVGAVVTGAPAARAADPVGPPIGNNKYRGSITDATDQDDFTGNLFRGDLLTVTVAAAKVGKTPATLKPVLSLVDPDGTVRTAGIVPSANGTGAALKSFVVDKSGVWAARVVGADGTTGDFLVTFKVKPLAKQVLKNEELGNQFPLSRNYDIPGFDGAILDLTATYSADSQPVEFRDLHDPQGGDVPGAAGAPATASAVRKGRTLSLKGVKLATGSGNYSLRVSIPTAIAKYTLTIAVRNPSRPTSTKQSTLSPLEPRLDPVTTPFIAPAGETVRFTGTDFSTKSPPKVRFGRTVTSAVTVGGGGTTLDVVVPPRDGDAMVAVYVINPDGQGEGRDRYFAYIPGPTITDLVDATTGAQVRVSPAAGGRQVRLLGADIESTHTIRIGGVTVASPNFVSSGEVRFKLPAVTDGDRSVDVTDRFGRSGTSAFTVRYKTPPSFGANPYAPGAVKLNTPTTITITGTTFESADQLLFAGNSFASTYVSPTTRTFSLPGLAGGSYTVSLVDSIGTVVDGPPLFVKGAPVISSVTVTAGAVISNTQIPLSGGSTIRLDGAEYVNNDTVTIGGVTVTSFITRTATRKEFLAPAGTGGFASITVLDGAGQSATAANAIRYVGFRDASTLRMPAAGAADDYSAIRGAAGDLDRDGLVDDVVIVSPYGNLPGSQARQTRVLIGSTSGQLIDTTNTAIPAAKSDTAKIDNWDATCVAVGDIDSASGPDIVIGGQVSAAGSYNQIRMFRNNGAGTFALDTTRNPVSRDLAAVTGTYLKYGYYSYTYNIYGSATQVGTPQAIALGDVDADGDIDAVVGTNVSGSRQVLMDPKVVNFGTVPPTISSLATVNYMQYFPSTRILTNGGATKFVDVSATKLPKVGSSKDTSSGAAAFNCTDLALADLNGDGMLDLVVTWDNPLTVTHYGQSTGKDVARTATRVLLNSTTNRGTFTDVTSSWMPTTTSTEYWQANRLALADLDGDGDKDLVLLVSAGLDAWLGTPTYALRSLRVLRNDGSRFTDVTSTAVPAVDAATVDDWRGDALAVRDVDADGRADIVVSTKASISNKNGTPSRRMRFFRGVAGSAISFTALPSFEEPVQVDSGEADDLLFVGDLGGAGKPVLLLLGEGKPNASSGGARSRAEDWKQ